MTILNTKGVATHIDRADQSGAPLLGAVTLEVAGGAPAVIEGAARFEILADGALIIIDASALEPARLKLEERSKKGTWAEVEADPLARPFLDKAPGPHIQVKLRGAALLPGEVVHVLGEVTATEPVEETGSMRTPPAYRPAEIRAIAIAAGPSAQRFIERARAEMAPAAARPASSRGLTSWTAWVTAALVIAITAVVVSALASSRTARFGLWMLVLMTIALFTRCPNDSPAFRGREVQPALGWWDLYYFAAGLAVLGSVLLFLATTAGILGGAGEPSDLGNAVVPLLAGVLVVLPLEAWSRSLRFKRIARILLDERAGAGAGATEDGAWAIVEGAVADSTPVQAGGEAAAIGRMVDLDKEPAISVEETFDIDTAGGRVAVDPAEACWATLVTRKVRVVETTGEASSEGKLVTEEWIPVGANVIAAGRVRRSEGTARMTSTGPESLLLFAVSPGKSARAELVAKVRTQRNVLLTLSAIAVFAVASALAFAEPLIAR